MNIKQVFKGGLLLALVIIISGCSSREVSNYDKIITNPISAQTSKDKDTTLGDLAKNKVTVVIKKGAFKNSQKVQIQTPENIPTQKNTTLLGSPLKISVEGKDTVRFDAPTKITMAFDKAKIPEEADESFLRVGYYDGKNWEYIKPNSIDMEKETMTFSTYHFSLFSPQISEKTKITEQFIHSQALDNVIRENTNNESDYVTQQIITMALAKMGITDEKTQKKIFDKVSNAQEYQEIYKLYKKGDIATANQKVAILAGTKIATNVPNSLWKSALGNVVGSADYIAEVSKAAGYAAEGQYKEAAKIIGEQIADKFLITTAGKIAVQVVNGQIDSWKNSEVNAAYEAYKNGADGYFWGYNIDKGDFEGVWTQMRGIRRQLELEAVNKENKIRKEAGMPELSECEIALVHQRVKQAYKKRFEERNKKEDLIKKEEAKLKMMLAAFDKGNVFVEGLGPQTLNKKGYTYEQKLEIMNHFGQKIMRDTQRTELTNGNVGLSDKKISTAQIIIAAKKYFSEPDGQKKYDEYLKKEFGVGKYPTIDEIAGNWNGSMTITDFEVSDELKQKIENGEGPEGCDLNLLEQMKGKANPMNFKFNKTSETGGQLIIQGENNQDNKPMPFSYHDGKIEVTIIDDKAGGKMFIDAIKKDNGTIVLDGKANIKYTGGDLTVKADINAKK